MGRVAVVGSANVDHVVHVPHLPRPGETLLGGSYAQHMGGKGANQAVAASRLGADASFIGAIGTDAAGALVVESLQAEGIDCSAAWRIPDAATGVALIAVDDSGENQISVAPGANHLVDAKSVSAAVAGVAPSVVLTVLEIPMEAVVAAGQAALAIGARILVNAAPGQPLSDGLLGTNPLLIVNAGELRLVGTSAATLLRRGADAVLVTRGTHGVGVVTLEGELSIPGEHVDPVVDTTGAGDAFCGALAALLAEGRDLQEAARIANVAAALSVRKPGARDGMATRQELDAYLKRSPSA